MIVDLDQEESLQVGLVGSKASRLAAAGRAGLPILPGFVVTADASRNHLVLGANQLETRGSGGARLAVIREPLSFRSELIAAGTALGSSLVARSSTTLEASGEWSGAFVSYLNLAPADLPKAVTGCWASAFSVAALERQRAAGIEPGSFPIPVLVQPSVTPESGGVAEIDGDGSVVVHGVEGHPEPLLQGWVRGHRAYRSVGADGWVGSELIELVGITSLDALAESLLEAQEALGFNRCEWAFDEHIWMLQVDQTVPHVFHSSNPASRPPADPALVAVARAAMMVPGKLGEELVIPWALGGFPVVIPSKNEIPVSSYEDAERLSLELTSQVWRMEPHEAISAARRCISKLLGPDPAKALEQLHDLASPDPGKVETLMAMFPGLQGELRSSAARIGVRRWEPFVATVVLSTGEIFAGTPASPGVGAGIRLDVPETPTADHFIERAVIISKRPTPGLAPLLWDTAALVSETGSPVAHLFDSARSLGIPAVCGVHLPGNDESIVAVDGSAGLVASIQLYE